MLPMDARLADETILDDLAQLKLSASGDAVRIPVKVRPRSSRSAVMGVREGVLDVALHAPPADEAANAELCELLARALGVRKADVSIAVGASHRSKLLAVRGIELDAVRKLLGVALQRRAKR